MYKHGQAMRNNQTILYKKWSGMKRRCLNKNEKAYPMYGGRGITISEEWMNYINFYNDMAPSFKKGLTIDRIDPKKGYSKENCRWLKPELQSRNRSVVKLYIHNGLSLTSREWGEILGLSEVTVRTRIEVYKWDLERALTTRKRKTLGFFKDERGSYRVEVCKNGKNIFVGRYKTKKEAKEARIKKLTELT